MIIVSPEDRRGSLRSARSSRTRSQASAGARPSALVGGAQAVMRRLATVAGRWRARRDRRAGGDQEGGPGPAADSQDYLLLSQLGTVSLGLRLACSIA